MRTLVFYGICLLGVLGLSDQWSGDFGLCLLSQQTEDVSGCGEGGVRPSCGKALRGLLLLQSLHDLRCLLGGGAGPTRQM